MKRTLLTALASAVIASTALAGVIEFDMKDPKGVNNVAFHLDAPLESMGGTASGITGKVHFDPANPAATKGKIVIAVSSMSVPNAKMTEHIMGEQWMNAASYPEIVFDVKSLTDVKTVGSAVQGVANGTMTLKGVSKEMSIPVSLTYLEDAMGKRQPNTKGDILVIRSSFTLLRSDFGVNAGKNEDKVGNEVELKLSLAGFAPKS